MQEKTEQSQYLVEMRGISKSFAGIKALDQVDFFLGKGRVNCLCGENGAGKSTLIKSFQELIKRTREKSSWKGKE